MWIYVSSKSLLSKILSPAKFIRYEYISLQVVHMCFKKRFGIFHMPKAHADPLRGHFTPTSSKKEGHNIMSPPPPPPL